MKSKGLLIVLIISLGLNLGAAGMFGYYAIKKAACRPSWDPWDHLKKELNLNEEQLKQFQDLTSEGFNEMKPIWAELNSKRQETHLLLKEPELDTVKLNRLYSEIGSLQSQVERRFFYIFYEEMKLLTPEQQEKYIALFEKRMHRRPDTSDRRSSPKKTK